MDAMIPAMSGLFRRFMAIGLPACLGGITVAILIWQSALTYYPQPARKPLSIRSITEQLNSTMHQDMQFTADAVAIERELQLLLQTQPNLLGDSNDTFKKDVQTIETQMKELESSVLW